jgi:uncharacterized protein involved in propanediol utilization
LLQGKEGEDLAEVKSLLLQVDQALGSSQCLLMGTLANFTLSKRREILEKTSVNEILQDSLLRSRTQGPDLLAEEETLPLLDHHLP